MVYITINMAKLIRDIIDNPKTVANMDDGYIFRCEKQAQTNKQIKDIQKHIKNLNVTLFLTVQGKHAQI